MDMVLTRDHTMPYYPRVVDAELASALAGLPAVSVEGPTGVGKTAAALRQARAVIHLDEPDEVALMEIDKGRIGKSPKPLLLDEWQRYPHSWDMVRRAVDEGAAPGSFVLTGSATPREATHSGAGRIVRLRMRPMTMDERAIEQPTVSFQALLDGEPQPVEGTSALTAADYADQIVQSGFPGIRALPNAQRSRAISGYLDRIVEHDFAELGHVVRRPVALRAWLTAFAAATATTTSYETIAAAATSGASETPARATTIAYRDTLARLWIIDQIPAWLPIRNTISALTQAPKHFLADPALAARLLGVGAGRLIKEVNPGKVVLGDGPLFGRLFESLAALSVHMHAQPSGARVAHLRTDGGDHAIDFIVERDDGRVLAVEVKLANVPTTRDGRHLAWLKDKIGDTLIDSVIVTAGQQAYRRPDGVAVVPLALLGP